MKPRAGGYSSRPGHCPSIGYIYADPTHRLFSLQSGGGPYIFSDHMLQSVLVERQVRHQLLQQLILLPQRLQLLRLSYFQPPVLLFPRVDRVRRYAHLACHLRRFPARFHLLDSADHPPPCASIRSSRSPSLRPILDIKVCGDRREGQTSS